MLWGAYHFLEKVRRIEKIGEQFNCLDENDRDHRDQTAGHQDVVLRVVLAVQGGQSDGQGHFIPVREHQQRPEVVVPGAVEGEQTDDNHDRRNRGENDAGIDLKAGCTVDGCGLVQCFRDALHEVANHEDIEYAGECRPNQRIQVVDPAQRVGDAELRQNRDDVREHADVHQRPENLIAALEIKTLVGECRQRGDEHREDRDHTGNDEGILEHFHDVRRRVDVFAADKQLRIVAARPLSGNHSGQIIPAALEVGERGDEIRIVFKGVENQPDDRDNPENAQQEKEEERDLSFIFHDLEERMKQVMGTKVVINKRDKNKGKVEIEYYSEAELERIVELIESIRQ